MACKVCSTSEGSARRCFLPWQMAVPPTLSPAQPWPGPRSLGPCPSRSGPVAETTFESPVSSERGRSTYPFFFFFLSLFIYFWREGEKHPCVVASCAPPAGGLAHNPSMCPDWELNPRPFGLQDGTQSTEPHQPGLLHFFLKKKALLILNQSRDYWSYCILALCCHP